jgi:hypothetical protein
VPIWKGPRTVQVLEKAREGVDIGYCKGGFMRLAAAKGTWNRSLMWMSTSNARLVSAAYGRGSI